MVELNFEDEFFCGKYDMGYKHEPDTKYYLEIIESLKKNQNEFVFKEENGVYFLSNSRVSIETNGVTFINIEEKNSIKRKIVLNDNDTYQKLIFSLKDVKEFPSITVGPRENPFDILKQQSEYNHKQLMADYIASVEPKDQTWTVDKVENKQSEVYFSKSDTDYELEIWLDWNIKTKSIVLSKKTVIVINFSNLNMQKINNKTIIDMKYTDITETKLNNSIIPNSAIKDFNFQVTIEQNENQIASKFSGIFAIEYESDKIVMNYSTSEKGEVNNEKYKQLNSTSHIEISNYQTKDEKNNMYVLKETILENSNVGVSPRLLLELL